MILWNAGRAGVLIAGRLATPFAVVAVLAGCVTAPSDNKAQSELIAERLDAYVSNDGAVRHDVTNADVARLWQEYNVMRRSGNLPGAKAKICLLYTSPSPRDRG